MIGRAKHIWHKHLWFRLLTIIAILLMVVLVFFRTSVFRPGDAELLPPNLSVQGFQTLDEQIMLINESMPSTSLEVTFTKYFWGPKRYTSEENKFTSATPPYTAYWKDACYQIFVQNSSKLGQERLGENPYVLFNLTLNESEYSGPCDRFLVYVRNSGAQDAHNISVEYTYGLESLDLRRAKKTIGDLQPKETLAFNVDSCTPIFDALAYSAEDGYIDNFAKIDFVFFPCQSAVIRRGNETYSSPEPPTPNPENLTILTGR